MTITQYGYSQVTIGSETPPASYSILQIEGVGGLRLPKLTEQERDELQATFTPSTEGVVIYLDGGTPDKSFFQFWDGNQWISMKYISNIVSAKNGISETRVTSDDVVAVNYGLGGELTEPTTITQKTPASDISLLKFDPKQGGRFSIMNNALTVTEDAVGMGTSPLGDAVLEVKGNEGEAFRYQATNPQKGHVLASDGKGYASWVSLTTRIAEKQAAILDGTNISTTTLDESEPISAQLELDRGIWLIMARYVARTTVRVSSSSDWGKNAWLTLNKTENGSIEEIVRVGQIPQYANKASYSSQFLKAAPQLVYILNVPEKASYILHGSMITTSRSVNMTVRSTLSNSGSSYFRAIQLSDDPEY